MNNIIVQKYGGSSVSTPEKIGTIAQKIYDYKTADNSIIVVVSAMGDTTDTLTDLAKSIHKNPPKRELDMLLSTGEQVTIALLSMAINNLGLKSISLTGAQCGIQTTSNHSKARIKEINTEKLFDELNKDKIVIVAGFQGVNSTNDVTTLGRGGSDTTAVAIAAATHAKKCEVYTDVDGVYSADPRIVEQAVKLNTISYDEMLEFSKCGATVLHPRAVELAYNYNIELVVKSTFEKGSGTIIRKENSMEKLEIRGVSLDTNIAKVSVTKVPDRPGIAFKLFSLLAKNDISVDMIIQNLVHDNMNDISFTINKDDYEDTQQVVLDFSKEFKSTSILHDLKVVKLSIVGIGIAGNTKIASKLFETLAALDINIEMISTSETRISCIIDEAKAHEALNHLHSAFNLNQ